MVPEKTMKHLQQDTVSLTVCVVYGQTLQGKNYRELYGRPEICQKWRGQISSYVEQQP